MWHQTKFGTYQEMVGILQEPEDFTSEAHYLIVMLPGLGQAMSEKNYLFSNIRKKLAPLGHTVVQFDYRGHGDSQGELGETSLVTMTEDTLTVIMEMLSRRSYEKIFLIGNKLGAIVSYLTLHHLERFTPIEKVLISISPPVEKLPQSTELFPSLILQKLQQEGKLDASQLVPGEDYYTLSDFNEAQYNYFISLGAHMLYLHGQFISYVLLQQLDHLLLPEVYQTTKREKHFIFGEKDMGNIERTKGLSDVKTHVIPNITYFFQHPKAMDDLIGKVLDIVNH
ncbi:alpha/beta hydrolase [Fictibacillus enclensis]|uniref:alpha/beta hydrolase family protein n=1 Tax=Fictibacillus enclensis TaxID=1017270 RepID=UPI0025A0468B|nr:alpha/beta hydrolase [Fictibacillus enclensis]MDM5335850.1 alpha/beta hydrolase [Fictibacillus enclensis]